MFLRRISKSFFSSRFCFILTPVLLQFFPYLCFTHLVLSSSSLIVPQLNRLNCFLPKCLLLAFPLQLLLIFFLYLSLLHSNRDYTGCAVNCVSGIWFPELTFPYSSFPVFYSPSSPRASEQQGPWTCVHLLVWGRTEQVW